MLTVDQQRVNDLLRETITLLCKNGLHFKSEFHIDGLIGITLDNTDVFLIKLKETVHLGDVFVRDKRQLAPGRQQQKQLRRNQDGVRMRKRLTPIRVEPTCKFLRPHHSDTPNNEKKQKSKNTDHNTSNNNNTSTTNNNNTSTTNNTTSNINNTTSNINNTVSANKSDKGGEEGGCSDGGDEGKLEDTRVFEEGGGVENECKVMTERMEEEKNDNNDDCEEEDDDEDKPLPNENYDSNDEFDNYGEGLGDSNVSLRDNESLCGNDDSLRGNDDSLRGNDDNLRGNYDERIPDSVADSDRYKNTDNKKYTENERFKSHSSSLSSLQYLSPEQDEEPVVVKIEPPDNYNNNPFNNNNNNNNSYNNWNSMSRNNNDNSSTRSQQAHYNNNSPNLYRNQKNNFSMNNNTSFNQASYSNNNNNNALFNNLHDAKQQHNRHNNNFNDLYTNLVDPSNNNNSNNNNFTDDFLTMSSNSGDFMHMTQQQFSQQQQLNRLLQRRQRSTFTKSQVKRLEDVFKTVHYVDAGLRMKLSKELSLSEGTINIWFQNRRQKLKKQQQLHQQILSLSGVANEESYFPDFNTIQTSPNRATTINNPHNNNPHNNNINNPININNNAINTLNNNNNTGNNINNNPLNHSPAYIQSPLNNNNLNNNINNNNTNMFPPHMNNVNSNNNHPSLNILPNQSPLTTTP